MKQIVAATILFLVVGTPQSSAEGDRIWSALVLATTEDPPAPIPGALQKFARSIKKIFGYNSLYLLGEKKRDLVSGGEEWLVPTENFFFRVQCLAQGKTSYTLRIELYHDKRLLVTTEAKLARDAPLYIRGPEWGNGQLIFLLEVR
jgi:hypothetical protein